MLDFAQARRNMVESQLRTFDITDRAVLAAVAEIPREEFMPADRVGLAYLDLNVEFGGADSRVMLQPMVFARLLQAMAIESGSRVLDVASGYGYSAAVLSRLGADVVALEADEAAADQLRTRLARHRAGRDIVVRSGPLVSGCPDFGVFDAILINGCIEKLPDALIGQLSPGGRLTYLQQDGGASRAMLLVKGETGVSSRRLFDASAPVLSAFRRIPEFTF